MSTPADTWQPGGECVLGIWAHPDDETYLSAGLMLRTMRSDGRVVCVHATRGERGTDDPARWPPSRLGPHRERELAAALAVLGVREQSFLCYPDEGCARVDEREAVERLTATIQAVEPDVVVTFGPDGVTGHPDHVAVSRWATAAWCAAGCGRLLYATKTTSFLQRHRVVHEQFGLFGADAFSVPDDEVAVAIRLTQDELDLKRAALAAQSSQTGALAAAMGERQYRRWWAVETFRHPAPLDMQERLAAEVRS